MVQYKRKECLDLPDLLCKVADKASMDNKDALRCFYNIRSFSEELYRHSLDVSILSVMLGKKIYGKDAKLENLFMAALLHDYGKRFLSECILSKAGELTSDERKTVKLHSIVGSFYL